MPEKKGGQGNPSGEPGASPVADREAEMQEKANEVRVAFGRGNRGVLDAAKIVEEYQNKLADRRLFQRFWKEFLKWPKTRVYRLIDARRAFAHLPDEVLGMFDLSAMYALSGDGEPMHVAREKAVEKAKAGEYVTNAVANKLLGRLPGLTGGTPGRITVAKKKLAAEAKKLGLDHKRVLELLEHLGVTVLFADAKPKAA